MDTKGRVVIAANAFGNVDSDNDVSMHGSFAKTLKENFARLKWFKNHNRNELVGVPIEGSETADYLQIVGQINLQKEMSRDLYEDYKLYAEFGKSLEHSIGVDAVKYVIDQDIRKVSEWKLWEFSTLTSWGANEKTPLLALKQTKPTESVEWLETILRKGNYTDERFIEIEKSLDILKSLVEPEQTTTTQRNQPITISDFADISTTFLKNLQTA